MKTIIIENKSSKLLKELFEPEAPTMKRLPPRTFTSVLKRSLRASSMKNSSAIEIKTKAFIRLLSP